MLALLAVGCASDRPLDLRLSDAVVRPDRAAILFFVDGVGREQFDEALAAGAIPNIRRHLYDRGVRVENAFAAVPSLTYSNAVTFLTGRLPGRHAIISNKWFDPRTNRYQNYCTVKTYCDVDNDYLQTPTIYEILADRVTINLQAAQRRGATFSIDNWVTGGINWFFHNFSGVDCLVAQDFEVIARLAPQWGRWPDFILAYFPGVDQVGHRFGPKSDAYRRAFANLDRQIGRIVQALKDVGMYDRTFLCLTSDHGMVEIDNHLDIATFLSEQTGEPVWSERICHDADSRQRLIRDHAYVVAMCGSRWAAVYALDSPESSSRLAPMMAALRSENAHSPPESSAVGEAVWTRFPKWLQTALFHPAVELVACSPNPGVVHLFHRDRHAIITQTTSSPCQFELWQQPGAEALIPHPKRAADPDQDLSDDRFWLRASAADRYPDLVPQITEMFDTPRAGHVVLFAADGWDFSPGGSRGGHGSILRSDMRVPLLFSGPGLPAGQRIDVARASDVMPTILGFLKAPPMFKGKRVVLDGIDLLADIQMNTPGPEGGPIAYRAGR